jgi:hypothetical protein
MSEDVGKEKFGRDFFGFAMVNRLVDAFASGNTPVIIPDSGFLEETQAVVDFFGAENCAMINTYKDGTSWEKDSRSLITGKMLGIKGYTISNKGKIDRYRQDCKKLIRKVINELA